MPRIDPQKLLTCLSVLLAPNGGIRSSDEVKRLAGLMDKFSKKLVSKCIYIQICKSTETELLGQFMAAGGWSLTHNWLSEGILTQNWPLVRELLELLLLCPVDVARLKSNSAPKLVKQLSKEGSQENVRILATKLVEQWLKIVKGETMTNTTVDMKSNHSITQSSESGVPNHINSGGAEQTFILSKLSKNSELTVSSNKNNPISNDSVVEHGDIRLTDYSNSAENDEKNSHENNLSIKNEVRSSSKEKDKSSSDKDRRKDRDKSKEKSSSSRHDRDKKDDRKKSSSSSSSSKSKSSSSSYKSTSSGIRSSTSSSRSSSSSRNKERDRSKASSSNKTVNSLSSSSSKEKIETKEKSKETTETKVEQEDKDKETLAKLMPPSIDKLGKIPKKTKEAVVSSATGTTVTEPPIKKTPSISIEIRKDVENRPKTVKTFNSQFRSHGLAEEAPPPPSRKGLKKPPSTGSSFNIPIVSPIISHPMKRTSPPPGIKESVPEKKLKIEIPIVVEKQVGIKLIPPKPKPVTLIESDMFMDAISASVPSLKKDSKKRKRRISASKEGGQIISPPESPTTPISPAPNKSLDKPASVPAMKFYQDTLDDVDELKKAKKEITVNEAKFNDKDKEEIDDKANKSEYILIVEEKEDGLEDAEATNAEEITSESDDKKCEEENAVKPPGPGCGPNGPPGVLVIHRRNGPKKQLKWRPQESLEEVRFFELDETERVNVTKTFVDAKQMERCQEREFVQTVRNKFQGIDKMFEEIEWITPLIEVEGVPPHPAGSQSKEKRIQIDREQTVLKVLYFSRHTIPDSAAEPDMEYYNSTDPVTIPLNDITGNPDTVKNLTNLGWPEPKLAVPSPMAMSMNVPHSFGGGPPFMSVDMPRSAAWPINPNPPLMRMPGPFNNSNDFSPPVNSPPFGGGGSGMNQNFGMNMMPNMMSMGMNNIKDNIPMRMQQNNNNSGNWFRPNGPPNWMNNKNNRDRDEGGRGGRGGGYNGGRNDRGRNRGNSRYSGGYKSGTKNY